MEKFRLHSLGDRAILAYFEREELAIAFAKAVRDADFSWVIDVVPAYLSVAIHFDPSKIKLNGVREAIQSIKVVANGQKAGLLHRIPCCYEMQLDMDRVVEKTGLSVEKVIAMHSGKAYTIYAIGFCPGFPYLGYLPPELTGLSRLATPRLRVEPGSVGLTARQTGIYPLARPGGWNLIGRTPLELVNVEEDYFPLNVGDQIQFYPIDKDEFRRLEGERLPTKV